VPHVSDEIANASSLKAMCARENKSKEPTYLICVRIVHEGQHSAKNYTKKRSSVDAIWRWRTHASSRHRRMQRVPARETMALQIYGNSKHESLQLAEINCKSCIRRAVNDCNQAERAYEERCRRVVIRCRAFGRMRFAHWRRSTPTEPNADGLGPIASAWASKQPLAQTRSSRDGRAFKCKTRADFFSPCRGNRPAGSKSRHRRR
jgi:hypothetical protein